MNKVIEGFRTSLQVEKEALSSLCSNIHNANAELNSSISEKLIKLQNDLAAENKIMDALAEQTQKTKVLQQKLKNAPLNIAKFEEKKLLVKGHNSEINQ